jgi:L-threonylcarbamoyladenylate synthase
LTDVVAIDGENPDPVALARAASVLASGGLLIYPTDTLYALGGAARDAGAARAVRAAKGREAGKPLPVVAADLEQARGFCARWPAAADVLAARFWPGPLTLILPAADGLPFELTAGSAGIAVRVPALLLARALCRSADALIATSANRSGERSPVTCAEAVLAVGSSAALALDAGSGKTLASTIVDLTAERPTLVRAGPVSWEDLARALALHPGPSS